MDVQRDAEPRHLLEVNDVDADLSGPENDVKNVGAGAPALEARANTSASLSRAMLWIGHAGVRAPPPRPQPQLFHECSVSTFTCPHHLRQYVSMPFLPFILRVGNLSWTP